MAIIDDFKTRFGSDFTTAQIDAYLPMLILEYPLYYGGSYSGTDAVVILYLLAHLLSQQVASGTSPKSFVASHSVGSVSESFAQPDGDSFWTSTKYGLQYLRMIRHNHGGVFV